MLLEFITGGLDIVHKVTSIIRAVRDLSPHTSERARLTTSIDSVNRRIRNVERELQRTNNSISSNADALHAYRSLLNALRRNSDYGTYIKIVPTEYGTYKILRKRPKKKLIFRDINGEFHTRRNTTCQLKSRRTNGPAVSKL